MTLKKVCELLGWEPLRRWSEFAARVGALESAPPPAVPPPLPEHRHDDSTMALHEFCGAINLDEPWPDSWDRLREIVEERMHDPVLESGETIHEIADALNDALNENHELRRKHDALIQSQNDFNAQMMAREAALRDQAADDRDLIRKEREEAIAAAEAKKTEIDDRETRYLETVKANDNLFRVTPVKEEYSVSMIGGEHMPAEHWTVPQLNLRWWHFCHRSDGPARTEGDAQYWFFMGARHRIDGPAIDEGPERQFYYLDGVQYSKADWEAEVARRLAEYGDDE